MSHIDPDELALFAMGEPISTREELSHLSSCAVCSTDLAQLRHAAVVARTTMDEAELDTPPGRVWARIHQEIGLSNAVAGNPFDSPLLMLDDEPIEDADDSVDLEAPVAGLSSRARVRRSPMRAVWALAASFAVVAAVGAGIAVAVAGGAPTSLATASLDAFPDHPDAVGSAEVDEDRDGARTLTVTLEGDASTDEYREVWLIRNDGEALISLGVLDGSKGTFPIPPGVDLSSYDLVDISFEPVDGDPAHSGNSIVRGQLTSA